MAGRSAPIITVLLLLVTAVLVSPPASAATDDMNITGLVYLDDGTPLSSTQWADNTSLAVYVDHNNDWSTAWRYPPSPQWYTTSMGAYSIVLPASEKDKNWSDGDEYRVEFDLSAISGVPGRTENATSHGTGDPGEYSPPGSTNNTIVWTSTDNWQRWDVVILALPDFAVLPGDVTATPGVVQAGQAVTLSATVWNLGNRTADSLLSLFFDADADRFPDTGEVFEVRPFSLLPGGNVTFVRVWFAAGTGTHSFCAYADPDNSVLETNEGNNVECASVLVEPPPPTRPDYVPVQADPLSPIKTGLSQSISLSVGVFNDGNGTATEDAALSFYNQTSLPFKEFTVGPLAPGATSPKFTATWTSPATVGTYFVSADVDHYNNVTEWDETNNVYTWTIDVVTGPITSLVIGSPNYTSTVTYVRSATPLSLSVLDQGGKGINHTKYRIDNISWIEYSSSFLLPGEGEHYVEWYSEDMAGNVETVNSRILRADDSPPATSLSIGNPRYLVGGNFVRSSTSLALQSVDGGLTPAGLQWSKYRFGGGNWNDYVSPFTLAGEGTYTVEYYSRDLLTNEETTKSIQIVVDDSPPATTVSIGDPKHTTIGMFVRSTTPLTLTAIDNGVGANSTFYRLWDGSWSSWGGYSSPFGLAGSDGTWFVEFLSFDRLGNGEGVQNETLILDDTPPTTTLSPATGPYTIDTVFTFTATDSGCGVNVTMYRVDGGSWTEYDGGFTLPEGDHNVSYYSNDNLNNTEQVRWREVSVQGAPPPPTVEANYKPLVALAFAVILVVAGYWSSKRKPWKGGNDRMAVAKAFAIFSLPFFLAEGVTGIVSYLTGELMIPPYVGVGTAVDTVILLAGLGAAIPRVLKERPSEFEVTNAR